MVIGTSGGSRIAAYIFQVLSNWHDYQMSLEAAVSTPRVHHQLLPSETIFEEPHATIHPAARQALIDRGYSFVNQGCNGDMEVIAVTDSGTAAVSDPRGRGVARVIAGMS